MFSFRSFTYSEGSDAMARELEKEALKQAGWALQLSPPAQIQRWARLAMAEGLPLDETGFQLLRVERQ